MKKIFSLLTLLFAFCALHAQTPISDGFESYADFTINPPGQWTFVDGDGDATYGFSGLPFLNSESPMAFIVFNPAQVSSELIPSLAPHSGNKLLASFAATLETSTGNNDWIISPELTDHEGARLTFWAKSYISDYGLERMKVGYSTTTNTPSAFTFIQGGNYQEVPTTWTEYVFAIPADAKYVAINCVSVDAFVFMLDDITIDFPTEASISLNPGTVDFGNVISGTEATRTVEVNTFALTDSITAATAAPFSVSADGVAFAATTTLPSSGGTLYVKYAPTAAFLGAATADLTLSSTGVTDTVVPLQGYGMVCNPVNTFPYVCGFEPSEAAALCWEYIDVNGDGTGANDEFLPAQTGDGNTMMAVLHSGSVAANDWMISPEFETGANMYVSFDYLVGNFWGIIPIPETFSVWVIPENGTINNAINILPSEARGDGSLQNMVLDLSAYPNQSLKIGIKVETPLDAGGVYFAVDNFKVDFILSHLFPGSVDALDFGLVRVGGNSSAQANFSAMSITNDITVEATGDYEVSTDGVTYNASITLPGDTQLTYTRNFHIQFSPTAVGIRQGEVLVTSSTTEDTVSIALTGEGVECNAITTFPYQVDFLTEAPCWTIFDDNQDGYTFYIDEYAYYGYTSNSAANDWVVSPAIEVGNQNLGLTIGYSAASSTYPEKFSVWAITDLENHTGGTLLLPTMTVTSTETLYTPYLDLTPYAGQTIYIGIKAESDADMYTLYIDDVKIDVISDELTIIPSVESLDFPMVEVGSSATQYLVVTAYNLAQDMTLSVTGDYTLSLDNSTFASSVTIPGNTNLVTTSDLHVKFEPATVGTHNSSITLTSESVTETISITGSAFACDGIAPLPFSEDFESGTFPPACWTLRDADGDGFNWMGSTLSYEGTGAAASYSYDNGSYTPLTPDNYLITPKLSIPEEGAHITWFVGAPDASYFAEHYQVKISIAGTETADFTEVVHNETLASATYEERMVNIGQFAGQEIYIAFVHNDVSDFFAITLDNINVLAGLSIQEAGIDHSVGVYPNPASSRVHITSSTAISQVEIFNLAGQLILQSQEAGNNIDLDVNDLQPGLYFVRIHNEKGITSRKVSIVR